MTITDIEERIADQGFTDVLIFSDPSYADAFLGVSREGRAVYSYSKMIQCLVNEGMSEEEAIDNVEYNTLRSLDYEPKSPIVVYDDE